MLGEKRALRSYRPMREFHPSKSSTRRDRIPRSILSPIVGATFTLTVSVSHGCVQQSSTAHFYSNQISTECRLTVFDFTFCPPLKSKLLSTAHFLANLQVAAAE